MKVSLIRRTHFVEVNVELENPTDDQLKYALSVYKALDKSVNGEAVEVEDEEDRKAQARATAKRRYFASKKGG